MLQVMLYLPNYGEISLAIIAPSRILKIEKIDGLENNHKCMNIIIAQKCALKLPIFCLYDHIYRLTTHTLHNSSCFFSIFYFLGGGGGGGGGGEHLAL